MSSYRGRGGRGGRGSNSFRPNNFNRRSSDEAHNDNSTNSTRNTEPKLETMSIPVAESSANECYVCCREIKVFAVGVCDHPVCHVCSTRLRALCDKNECPVCRAVMEEVVFVSEVSPFETLKNSQFSLKVEQFGISFENDEIFDSFQTLLQNRCSECIRRANITQSSGERSHPPKCYETFEALREHILKDHKRHFCDLCVEHLTLFPFERQAYSMTDLKRHMKDGDLNDKSHKGHPRCDFCKTHYLDKDELYKHLRVDHFSCFICQRENAACRLMQYYATYEDLRLHFSRDHFLCELGDCATERFKAFATKLEHKAHVASTHSDSLSREEQRVARDLAADFAMSPPARETFRNDSGMSRRNHQRDNQRDRYPGRERRQRTSPEGISSYDDEDTRSAPPVDTTSTKDFPSLPGEASAVGRPLIPTPQYGNKLASSLASTEEFPSLGKPQESTASTSHTWFKPISRSNVSKNTTQKPSTSTRTVPSTSANVRTSSELFPSLPQAALESDFGKVLKPIPAKKQQKPARQSKTSTEKWNGNAITTSTSKKTSTTDFNLASRNSEFPSASEVYPVSNSTNKYKPSAKSCDSSNDVNLQSGAYWPAYGDNNDQACFDLQTNSKGKKVKAKLPKQEDFPSLGPAQVDSSTASSFRPLRAKYKGIKPGEWGQENKSNDQYIQPPNFSKRNTEFMGMLKLLLNGSAEQVTKYRLSMTNFRKGLISSEEFVHDCLNLFSDCSEFAKVYVELVCLMPDVEKQNELILLYDNLKAEFGTQKKNNVRDWIRCSECTQIILPEDSQAHQKAH